MAFEDISGQGRAAGLLRAALRNDRLSHAYLFVGPGGVGRLAMARELASVLLCGEGQEERCGACANCRYFDSGNHPDYHEVGVPEGKQELPIDLVRSQVQDTAAVKPVVADRRVFVVRDAERMTLEAANCFLKTLEEPPGGSCFILIAAGLWDMPQTIVSRCQIIKFSGLPAQQVEQILRERDLDADDAWWLARRSWGSPGLANDLGDVGLHAFNNELSEELFTLGPEDICRLTDWLCERARDATGSTAQARALLQEELECIAVFYRDLAVVAIASGQVELFNGAREARLRELASRRCVDSIIECADKVFEAVERVGLNANQQVALDDLFTGLARAHGE